MPIFISVPIVVAACGRTPASSGRTDVGSGGLTGAGSTFVKPSLSKAFYAYWQQHPSVAVNYQAVDFGATDAPMVTFNVRDFAPILRLWAEEQRPHAGCLLLVGIAQHDFGVILERISAVTEERPWQQDWVDRALFLGRRG